ncbi:unnamed protein product [Gordionus sp. m RMFG-2023]
MVRKFYKPVHGSNKIEAIKEQKKKSPICERYATQNTSEKFNKKTYHERMVSYHNNEIYKECKKENTTNIKKGNGNKTKICKDYAPQNTSEKFNETFYHEEMGNTLINMLL